MTPDGPAPTGPRQHRRGELSPAGGGVLAGPGDTRPGPLLRGSTGIQDGFTRGLAGYPAGSTKPSAEMSASTHFS